MKKGNVKKFIKEHAGEIIIVTSGIGCYVVGVTVGKYLKCRQGVPKFVRLNEGMIDDVAELICYADLTKGLRMQYRSTYDDGGLTVADLGKLGENLLDYASKHGWNDITKESGIVGTLVYTKR